MIRFKKMSLLERVKRLNPRYRKRREAELERVIRELVADPSLPCEIEGEVIPDGDGGRVS